MRRSTVTEPSVSVSNPWLIVCWNFKCGTVSPHILLAEWGRGVPMLLMWFEHQLTCLACMEALLKGKAQYAVTSLDQALLYYNYYLTFL
jgi:hypothetical protein